MIHLYYFFISLIVYFYSGDGLLHITKDHVQMLIVSLNSSVQLHCAVSSKQTVALLDLCLHVIFL